MPRMLIIDDEPDICECLNDFFSAKGFAVRCVFSGKDALVTLLEEQPDIVLLDLRLPDIWGLELLKRVKRLYPATKVVVVSSVDQREPKLQAKTYGACAYITKPFDFSEATWAPLFSHSR